MPSHVVVFCGVARETMSAVGRLVRDCVSSGIIVCSVGWVQYLTCDVVIRLSSCVNIPPLLVEPSSPCIGQGGTRHRLRAGSMVGIATGACHCRGSPCPKWCPWWCSIWGWQEVWEQTWFLRWPLVGNLPPPFFVVKKKGIDHGKIAMNGGAGLSFAPTASAVLGSCYLIRLCLFYLGTVLTLLHGRSIANR